MQRIEVRITGVRSERSAISATTASHAYMVIDIFLEKRFIKKRLVHLPKIYLPKILIYLLTCAGFIEKIIGLGKQWVFKYEGFIPTLHNLTCVFSINLRDVQYSLRKKTYFLTNVYPSTVFNTICLIFYFPMFFSCWVCFPNFFL